MKTTKHLSIQGKVQGVFYRAGMCQEAEKLGLTGWVRNRRDGSVEALVQGETEIVEQIIAWAKRGPADAKVQQVEVKDSSNAIEFDGFEKRATE